MLRRVRKKSLYLGDLSDMNHTLDQVRQSIVHVLDEWADTTAMSASVRPDWLRMIRAVRAGIRHAERQPVVHDA